mmetsp:Transcript_21004/g.59091  ORF Transcript_21004/g.59091 Transcript_21004/m.59091 type:complete len:226 (+) Transcript_21004:151-828(+)
MLISSRKLVFLVFLFLTLVVSASHGMLVQECDSTEGIPVVEGRCTPGKWSVSMEYCKFGRPDFTWSFPTLWGSRVASPGLEQYQRYVMNLGSECGSGFYSEVIIFGIRSLSQKVVYNQALTVDELVFYSDASCTTPVATLIEHSKNAPLPRCDIQWNFASSFIYKGFSTWFYDNDNCDGQYLYSDELFYDEIDVNATDGGVSCPYVLEKLCANGTLSECYGKKRV